MHPGRPGEQFIQEFQVVIIHVLWNLCKKQFQILIGVNIIGLGCFYKAVKKGGIEQAHTMLRMILPKKTSFEFLTQWDVNLIVNHINSTPRESLGGRTPYDMALETFGETVMKAFQLRPIAPDEVNLTPKLIRFNR